MARRNSYADPIGSLPSCPWAWSGLWPSYDRSPKQMTPCKFGKLYNPGFFRFGNPWKKKGGHIHPRGACRLLTLLSYNFAV